jgi:hypothetical protein
MTREYPTRLSAVRARGNPLLMVVNPQTRRAASALRNPGADMREGFWDRPGRADGRDGSSSAPFREGRQVPIPEFERWLYANATPGQIRDYEKAKKEYGRFHLGAVPRTVTREMADVSSNRHVTDRSFTYSMGKSTHETYNAPKHSKKSGAVYVHKYDDQPEALVFPGGRLIMKKLKGRARITDWMRG